MAVDAVGAAARSAAAGADARFPRGAVIEAQVASIHEDGTVRLSTPFGMTDVTTDVSMQEGQILRLAVQSVGNGLTLALLTDGPESAAAAAANEGGEAAPAAAPAVLRAVAEAMQRGSVAASGTTALFANLPALLRGEAGGLPSSATLPASAVLAHAISADRPVTAETVKAAVQGSGLFREARLAQGNGAAAQPAADLKSALVALRGVLAGLSSAFDAASQAQAAGGSGSVAPAPTHDPLPGDAPAADVATGGAHPLQAADSGPSKPAGPGGAPLPQPGAGAAGRALAGVGIEGPNRALPSEQASSQAPGATHPSALPAAEDPGAAGQDVPPVPFAVRDTLSPPEIGQPAASSRPGSGLLSLPPTVAAAVANLPEPQRTAILQLLERSLQPGGATGSDEVRLVLEKVGLVADTALASHPDDAQAARQVTLRYGGDLPGRLPPAHAGPPRADLPPRAEPASPPTIAADSGAAATTRTLLGETDAALDRVLLNQYASLPRDSSPSVAPAAHHGQAWVLDVPVLLGREAATAQVRISRDDGSSGSTATGREGPRWSIDLALDSSALGPVHARVRLVDQGVSVTLWAERPDTAERFRDGSTVLRKALDEASLLVDEVEFRSGSPQRAPAAKGYFVDTRS